MIEGAYAPDLTTAALVGRGWTKQDLVRFFGYGLSPQGVMTFRMFPVLEHSTALHDADLQAISAYLTKDQRMPGPRVKEPVGTPNPAGEQLNVGLYAGCHGVSGEGQPHSFVPLNVNTTAMYDDQITLVRVIHDGMQECNLARGERMQPMPAFADRLDDRQMADLVNYLRRRWGGREGDVTPSDFAGDLKLIGYGDRSAHGSVTKREAMPDIAGHRHARLPSTK